MNPFSFFNLQAFPVVFPPVEAAIDDSLLSACCIALQGSKAKAHSMLDVHSQFYCNLVSRCLITLAPSLNHQMRVAPAHG